ncbi:hypothetical protein WN943_007449 [Citrus x changshan-huyou]
MPVPTPPEFISQLGFMIFMYLMAGSGSFPDLVPLVDSTLRGQPSLLFGWHEDNKCYASCPSEGNYTVDDVSLAYIVGAACSPNLGPCDEMDDWKPFPDGILAEEITTSAYERVVYRCSREASEVRTIERWEVECCGCKSIEVGSSKKR